MPEQKSRNHEWGTLSTVLLQRRGVSRSHREISRANSLLWSPRKLSLLHSFPAMEHKHWWMMQCTWCSIAQTWPKLTKALHLGVIFGLKRSAALFPPYLDGLSSDRIHHFFCRNSHPQGKISNSLGMALNRHWYSAYHHVSVTYCFHLPGEKRKRKKKVFWVSFNQTPTYACRFPYFDNKSF